MGMDGYQHLLDDLRSDHADRLISHKKRKLEISSPPPPAQEHDDAPSDDEVSGSDSSFDSDTSENNISADKVDPYNKHFDGSGKGQDLSAQPVMESRWSVVDEVTHERWTIMCRSPEIAKVREDRKSVPWPTVTDLFLKQKLRETAPRMLAQLKSPLNNLVREIFNYRDVSFPLRTQSIAGQLREITSLHLLNHCLKTRDRILKHNLSLSKRNNDIESELRDQGFTRPKVLVLLPTRQACVRYVKTMMSICDFEQQENRKRFYDLFSSTVDNVAENKPEDFRELFAGNDDDLFRLGIKFTRKAVKFFSNFYNSDMIVASPLGLRMAMGSDGSKRADCDYLSSIEILVIDHADALLMQNWEHLEYIIAHLNHLPTEAHGCDFSRVRSWYLDGNAKYFRQTLIYSSFNFSSLNGLNTNSMLNFSGNIRYGKFEEGIIAGLSILPQQIFSRFASRTIATEADDRFDYFSKAVIPGLVKSIEHFAGSFGTMIFLPSYADFLRVRNFLAGSATFGNISFGGISEYTSLKEVARARSHFISGRHSILLYTERAHHFRRYRIKGVKKIVMYGLPENPVFYRDLLEGCIGGSISEGAVSIRDTTVKVLFSRLDRIKLERVVGSSRYASMLLDTVGDTFDFSG